MLAKALFYPGNRYNKDGVIPRTVYNVAKRWHTVTIRNSGYTGRKAKPLGPNPFGYAILDFSMTHGQYGRSPGYTWSEGDDLHPFNAGVSLDGLPSDANLINSALDELNEKTRGSLDLSIDIAEIGQTAKMFKVIDQVTDLTRTFRRRYGTLKAASNAWLQYTYGVRPLLSSIHGLADESLRHVLNKTQRFRARAKSVDYCGLSYITNSGNFTPIPGFDKLAVKRSCQYGIVLDQKDNDLSRWTSLNPVSIAWELTPYSFVVDWFYDVGSFLRNAETSLLYANRFRSGYRSDLTVVDTPVDFTTPGFQGVDETFGIWRGYVKYISFNRGILNTYPVPRLPTFKANLGSSRLLSAAALLSQLLRR